jgi:predicted ATPase
LQITLLGAFCVNNAGQAVTQFRSSKISALLVYLAMMYPATVPRTVLMDLLWHGYAERSARLNLRQTLTRLRAALLTPDLLATDNQRVQFTVPAAAFTCDALLFRELVEACRHHDHKSITQCAACQARLQQAAELYQGPFLADFPAVDSAPFTAWHLAQQTYFAELFAEVRAALHPTLAPVGNLPPPLTSLIGRTAELADLVAKLQHPVYRCLTLVGPGGIGKTRLACALAAQVQADFPEGAWLVSVSGLAPTTPAESPEQLHDRLAMVIGTTLGLVFYGTTRPATQVAHYLAPKAALLMLDSFEHLTAAAAWFPTLLAAAPHVRLLITTRHRLPLQSQLVYPVAGLSFPPAAAVNEEAPVQLVAQYASVQLLLERTTSAGLTYVLTPDTLLAVGQLCHFLEGSPWAIELAAAMLDQQPAVDLLRAIQQNYRALITDLLDVPARQRSAEAIFLTAWALLTTAEAQVVACCAVFRGGFTLDAAQTIAAATPEILGTLVQKSLLRFHDGRYTMHDLVRQFADEQLALDAAVAHATYAAHAAYFSALLATWQPDDATEQRFRTAVTQHWENVQAAWDWALENAQIALLQQGVAGLAEYYEMTELFLASDRTFGAAIAHVRLLLARKAVTAQAARAETTALQTLLAHLLWRQVYLLTGALGQTEQAQRLAEELLGWGQQLEDDRLIARGYCELSIVALLQGDYQRQATLLHQALPLAQQQRDRREQAFYLMMLGISLKMQHQYPVAQHTFAQALTLAEGIGASRLAIVVLNNLGGCHWDAGNFTQAIACFQQTLQRAQQMGQKDSATFALASLGALAYTLGDYDNARTNLTAAHQGYMESGDKVLEAQLLTLLAALSAEQGETTVAADYCRRALATAVAQVYPVQQPALLTEGHLQRDAGNWVAARTAYESAYTLSRQTNLLTEWLPVQTHLAALHLAQGEPAAALVAIEPLLAHFADSQWSAAQRPQELLLIAYQILVANADRRAPAILQQAWALVQEQLVKIDDPHLHHTFLTNVPANRALRQLIEE